MLYVLFIEVVFLYKLLKMLFVMDVVVYVSENIFDCILDRDLEESGDDDNFIISALKFLNLFDIKIKVLSCMMMFKDMSWLELLCLGW